MSVYELDIQKIEQLLNSATSERQRKMYQALLDKARRKERASTDSKASRTTPSTAKKTKAKTSQKTETKTTKNKKKKATPQSARTTHGTEPSSVPVSSTTEASTPTIQSTKPLTESTTQLTEEESSVSPQTEPKSQSKEPPKQQSDAEPPIFQAKGALIATPYVQGDRLKVAIDEREYNLSYNRGYQRRAYVSLSSELEKNGSKPMFLRVYPQATFERSSAEPRLSFSLVNFSQDCEKINDEPKGFVLRGIWQYIPHCDSPVFHLPQSRSIASV